MTHDLSGFPDNLSLPVRVQVSQWTLCSCRTWVQSQTAFLNACIYPWSLLFFLHEQHSPERLAESPDNMTAGEEAEQSGMLWWIQRHYQHWCRNDWYLDQSTDAFPPVICWYVDTCELLTAFAVYDKNKTINNCGILQQKMLLHVKTNATMVTHWIVCHIV